jgi:integrase
MAKCGTWHGDGIYSKPRTDRDGKSYEAFFCRVWIPSEKRLRVFKAGRTLKSAERLRLRILADPDRAVERRTRQAQQARDGLTLAGLYKVFTANYRGRGGTDFYINVLARMVELIGTVRVADLTAQTFDGYFRKRRAEKTEAGRPRVGESTIRKECIAAGKMLKWARQRGLVTVNPMADYEKPRQPEGPPARALSFEEEDRMLAMLPPLERDVIAWALDTGMRRGEVLALTWPRIDRAAGLIHVLGSKTGKLRAVPLDLSDRLPAILQRHPQRTTTDLVFHDLQGRPLDVDRLNGLLEAAMKGAEIPKVRGAMWNVLRKTWVSRIYAKGALPQQEADWGGHSMAIADKHYRQLSPATRGGAAGLLNRPATVATTVAARERSA